VKTALKIVLMSLALIAAYPAWLAFQVWDQSHEDEVFYADAIVVLGAAQYNGRPSPVFQARLDHALYLYNEGLAETMIVTGGKQPGDLFTEAAAGLQYLTGEGVPDEQILSETEGLTTLESLENVWDIAQSQPIKKVLLVSDPMHSERIKRIATDLGFETFTSPANYEKLNRSRSTKARELIHEVGSLIVYEIFDR
jgi:vancomycin permeability regulator SanA